MPRSCVRISDTVVLGIPRSASSSRTANHQTWLFAARTHSTLSGVLPVAGLPEHGSLSTDSQPSLKYSCQTFICTVLIALSLKAFWIIQIVSTKECSSLTQNLMQIRCSTHSVILNSMAYTVHMLPPQTSYTKCKSTLEKNGGYIVSYFEVLIFLISG